MAFWGVELEPGKPYTHSYNSSLGRLRISQAILDPFSPNSGYVAVHCIVGNKSPVLICLLRGGTNNESCMLDIELEEKEEDVVLANRGNISVHLSGFYSRNNDQSAGNGTMGNHGARSTSQVAHVKTEFKALEMGSDPEYKDIQVNGRRVRTMASGLVIENIRTSGNSETKVQVRFFGQIKSTGFVFESNYGTCGLSFTLGNGDVIKGLEDGINGMQVGDKRRLTIPPSMGYCGSKARSDVPADSWLVFEVELISARLSTLTY
ncbi:hypothetical protein C5167_005072 [Papaver somniferum]|uniref:peptidylprolyl isomerase n=1 Tax=Papaver somniferum TaxID=3469 RepID=A0A4Y7J9F8_PAPSO|nr:hypothetical protein C5167_005072 [Papaver somniferum]